MKEDDKTSIILNDNEAWIQAQVSQMLEGHIEGGAFEVGHVVEVVTSLGSPRDLHIVSYFCLLYSFSWLFSISESEAS